MLLRDYHHFYANQFSILEAFVFWGVAGFTGAGSLGGWGYE
jgi:hypothetical protein